MMAFCCWNKEVLTMGVPHTTILTRQTELQSQSPSRTEESQASLRFNGQFSQRETGELTEVPRTKQSHLKLDFVDAGTGPTTGKLRGQFVKPGFEVPRTKQSHLKPDFVDAGTGPMTGKLGGKFVKPGSIDIHYTAPVDT